MSWVEIANTTSALEASLWKLQLENLDIPFKEFSTLDTSYSNFGRIYIFVDETDANEAKNKLNSHDE